MKKALNTDAIASELRDASPFFRRQPSPAPAVEPARPDQQPQLNLQPSRTDAHSDRTPERSPGRTSGEAHASSNARTVERRRSRRASYEIYEDQIERIKNIALAEQLSGGDLSQSEIVRTAIDRYFAESGKTE